MKVLSIFTILLCFSILSLAQPGKIVKTVKGKVINASTNEPVSYTNIGLEGTFFGTASDSDGNFELKIPQELVSKNIFFSAVGFKNKQFPVANLFDKAFNVIKIESQTYGIDDIDIAAQNMVLIRILRMASENIPYNFIRGPYNLVADYSNEKVVDGISSTAKAEVVVYDKNGYINPSKEDAFKSVKYSIKKDQSKDAYRFTTNINNMDELLELDWVRSASSVLNSEITGGFNLKLEDEPTLNGQKFWVISFQQIKPTLAGSGDFYATAFEGEVVINKEDYSILKIDGKTTSPKNNRQGKSLAIGKSSSTFLEDVKYDFVVDYESLKPSKIVLNKSYLYENKKVLEKSILVIKQVKATNITELSSRQYFVGE